MFSTKGAFFGGVLLRFARFRHPERVSRSQGCENLAFGRKILAYRLQFGFRNKFKTAKRPISRLKPFF